jgi:primary-amine oxidase
MKEHYGITDLSLLACDPWSVHVAAPEEYAPLKWREKEARDSLANRAELPPPRLVQTFLYKRADAEDNHYAHPIPLLPVVDLNAERVVALQVPFR